MMDMSGIVSEPQACEIQLVQTGGGEERGWRKAARAKAIATTWMALNWKRVDGMHAAEAAALMNKEITVPAPLTTWQVYDVARYSGLPVKLRSPNTAIDSRRASPVSGEASPELRGLLRLARKM